MLRRLVLLVIALLAGCGAPTAPTPSAAPTAIAVVPSIPDPQPTPAPTPEPAPPPPAPRYTVAGVVTHTPPGEQQPLVGARVELVSGEAGFSTTDDNGYYSITGVLAPLQLRVSRDGYETQTVSVGSMSGDTRVDIRVRPSFRWMYEWFYDCILANGHPIHHVFPIYNSGTLEAEAEWTGTLTYSALQLWRDGIRLSEAFSRPARPLRLTAAVEGGYVYEIRVVGEPDLHYTLKVRRPN